MKPDSFENVSIDGSTAFKVVVDEVWCDDVCGKGAVAVGSDITNLQVP
jgi:hypothetical protein